MLLPHTLYLASVMQCGASMNSGGSIKIYGSSLPTNWHRTIFAKYRALKPAPSRGRGISEVMKATSSKFREVGRGWPAHRGQLTYNDIRLEKEYSKGNA